MSFNFKKIMKQAQEMQSRLQEQMKDLEVEASAGGGMVVVTMNGEKQLLSVKLDPEAVDPEDTEMLQDLVLAAVNEAARQVDEKLKEEMGGITGGLNIPGL